MPVQEPSRDLLQKINDIVTKINKSKPKTDPDVIEFDGQTFVAKQPWKARLAPDFATLGCDESYVSHHR